MTLYELDADQKSSKETSKKLLSVQMLRAFAVLAVALAHLHSVESKMGGEILFGNWALNGFFGVDLFFVISGFIMVYITQNNSFTPIKLFKFWGIRLLRIYPLWWVVCGTISILYLYRPELVYSNTINNPDILKSLFLIPQESLPIHAIGWTLINELYFYLVFGIFLLFSRKALPFLLVAWGFVTIGFDVFGFDKQNNPFLLVILSPLNIEFIFGAIIGLFYNNGIFLNSKLKIMLSLIWLFALSAANLPNPAINFDSQIFRALNYSIPCSLLLWGIISAEKEGYIPPKPFIFIGNISYSFYLLHILVFALIGKIAKQFTFEGIIDNIIFSLIAIFTTIIVSFISYKLFESPIMSFAHKFLQKKGG